MPLRDEFLCRKPCADSYWELKTVSVTVHSAPGLCESPSLGGSVSGEIRPTFRIVIEEQGKHSLRAHMGSGGGRGTCIPSPVKSLERHEIASYKFKLSFSEKNIEELADNSFRYP